MKITLMENIQRPNVFQIDSHENNPKDLWKTFKDLMCFNKTSLINNIDIDGVKVNDCFIKIFFLIIKTILKLFCLGNDHPTPRRFLNIRPCRVILCDIAGRCQRENC